MPCVSADSHVTLHYRLALLADDGERELVNTFACAPATLQMGVGQWSPELEARLLGLEVGAQVEFSLTAEQAYGARNPQLVRTLHTAQVQEYTGPDVILAPGETVEFEEREGFPMRGVVTRLDAQETVIDFNHPLAGWPLQVRVQVIGVL